MSEDPTELQRFHEETVAPLVDYDDQYETELVRTLETFLEADGNVAKTAEKLFTHRHTIRYRLDRVRELTRPRRGLDRRPRAPQPRAEGDARPGHASARRPGERGRRRGGGRVPREEKDR